MRFSFDRKYLLALVVSLAAILALSGLGLQSIDRLREQVARMERAGQAQDVMSDVLMALIDIDVKRLPNVIVLPSYLVALALLLLPAVIEGEWSAYLRALIGMAALFAFYFVLALIYPAGMGFGDVKLAGVLGLYLGWLGWGELFVGAFLGFLLGGVVGGGLMVAKRATRKSAIPFGPFMIAGAFLAIFFGASIAGAYMGATTFGA